jgi:asparagine synthetase B (glutamine-hydrolysing)
MAVLLAWLNWREAAPAECVWTALRDRAAARARFAGRELAGPGWRILAAPSFRGEADPIRESGHVLRLLDWAPWSAEMVTANPPLAELREGPPLAAIELELNPDRSLRNVLLARDILGRRSLVYASVRGGLLVASGEHMLLAHPEVSSELDPDFLAAYLTTRAPAHDASAFSAIHTLMAGELRRIDADATRSDRRMLQPDWRWRGMSDEAIVEDTWRRFSEATRRCVYGAERVGLSLSGGIDSLSVAAALAELPSPKPELLAVTYGFDDWPDIDERAMAHEACEALGIDWLGFAADRLDPLDPALARPICPDSPISSLYREFKEQAYSHFENFDASVWLSGGFADHLCASPADRLADAFRFGRARPFGRELLHVLTAGPRALRDRALRRLGAQLLRRPTRSPGFPLLDPGERIAGALDARWRDELQQHRNFPRPHQAMTCLNGYAMFAASGEHWYAARHAMTTADPFNDPDLCRWMLSLPADLHAARGQPKSLWRRVLRGRFPRRLVDRPKSSDLSPFLLAAMGRDPERREPQYRRGLAIGSATLGKAPLAVASGIDAGNSPSRSILPRYLFAYLGLWLESRAAQ